MSARDEGEGMDEHERVARRASLDRAGSRGSSDRLADHGPVVGKQTPVESVAGGEYAAVGAVAFFDRALGELRVQLATRARAIASGERLLAVTATGGIRRCLASARGHVSNVPADQLPERRRLLAELEAAAAHALGRARLGPAVPPLATGGSRRAPPTRVADSTEDEPNAVIRVLVYNGAGEVIQRWESKGRWEGGLPQKYTATRGGKGWSWDNTGGSTIRVNTNKDGRVFGTPDPGENATALAHEPRGAGLADSR